MFIIIHLQFSIAMLNNTRVKADDFPQLFYGKLQGGSGWYRSISENYDETSMGEHRRSVTHGIRIDKWTENHKIDY